MDKKSLKVKIFLKLFGSYKEVFQVADITTTPLSDSFTSRIVDLTMLLTVDFFKENALAVSAEFSANR